MDNLALLREELANMLSDMPLPPVEAPNEGVPPVDVSPRALKTREILRIANMYSWHDAITHFLCMKGVPYMSDLTPPQLDDLLGRMEGFKDAAETGCSLPDCLPAC